MSQNENPKSKTTYKYCKHLNLSPLFFFGGGSGNRRHLIILGRSFSNKTERWRRSEKRRWTPRRSSYCEKELRRRAKNFGGGFPTLIEVGNVSLMMARTLGNNNGKRFQKCIKVLLLSSHHFLLAKEGNVSQGKKMSRGGRSDRSVHYY